MQEFDRLLQVMDELREKCPWDKKQTFESLRHLTIEETYELSDAIVQKDLEEIKKEVGDLLLHIVFYAKLGSETGAFDMAGVIDSLCEKLISRHPHIYGDTTVQDEAEVKRNWEQIKLQEKGKDGVKKTVLGGVPKGLPAMVKAMRIQEKARGAGFDWDRKEQVWEKVEEEMGEFHQEMLDQNKLKAEAEFGDLLFSLINYARFNEISPEDALEKTNQKFITRFNFLESESAKDGRQLGTMTLAEMDDYWEKAKGLK